MADYLSNNIIYIIGDISDSNFIDNHFTNDWSLSFNILLSKKNEVLSLIFYTSQFNNRERSKRMIKTIAEYYKEKS